MFNRRNCVHLKHKQQQKQRNEEADKEHMMIVVLPPERNLSSLFRDE
jgi:hypothetical protein